MLQSSHRSNSLRTHWSTPLESVQVENEKVVKPEFSISTPEDEHLIIDDTGGVELSHGGLAPDDAWDIETEFVNSLLEIYKDNIREYLESIPASINYYLTSIPNLTRMPHPRLGQFVLIHFGLSPALLLCVEYEDVVDDPFLAVTFSSAKYDQILTELS